tara:strand:+ start:1527 stop:2309 length:783 start_codon:yes stop_codon:yes gene_type:complete
MAQADINPHTRVSVMRVIANASRDMEIENPQRHMDKFIEWSFEAMKFIGSYDTFPRMEEDLVITDKRAVLPPHIIKIIDVKDQDGTYCEPTSATFRGNKEPTGSTPVTGNPNYTTTLTASGMNGMVYSNRYYIDNGGSHDHSSVPGNVSRNAFININQEDGKIITLSYFFLPIDDDGFPLIKEGHQEAIAAFLMWKYKAIEYYAGKVPQYIYKDLEQRWHWLCAQTRGNDNMPTKNEWERIGAIWNSMIPVKTNNGLQGF